MRRKAEKSFSGAKQFLSAARRAVTGGKLSRHIIRTALQRFTPDPDSDRTHDSEKETLIMVPGWGCGVGTMKPLGAALGSDANVVYPDNLPGGLSVAFNQLSFEEQSKKLANFAYRVDRDRKNKGKINFVGHSNGGVASPLAVKEIHDNSTQAMRERIGGIITMASPINSSEDYHYGNAPFISRLPVTRHLVPNSKMHEDLKALHKSILLCIGSSRDELLKWHMQSVDGRPSVDLRCSHWAYTSGSRKELDQVAELIKKAIK